MSEGSLPMFFSSASRKSILFIAILLCFALYSAGCSHISYYTYTVAIKGGDVSEGDRALLDRFLSAREAKLTRLYELSQSFWRERSGFVQSGFLWPVKGELTSHFGHRWNRDHDGIDIAAPIGTPIRSVADGEVIYSDHRIKGYGNMVVIRHASGVCTVYAHNSANFVKVGDPIRRGQVIGEVGSTGRSTGPHLHFEVRAGGKAVNPLPYIRSS